MKIEFHSNDAGYYGVGLLMETLEVWLQILPSTEWHFGRQDVWYDGPIGVFGLGFCEIQWHRPI